MSSVLLLDVQRKGGGRNQPVAPTAACNHSNAAPGISMEGAASSSAAVGAGGRGGCGRGGGWLLKFLLVDFALLGPAVLEPDLHLEQQKRCFVCIFRQTKEVYFVFTLSRCLHVQENFSTAF